jgi:FG-GAP repeat
MRAPVRFLIGVCGAIAVGALPAGCDWREFDTLQNQTPVLAIDPPSGFPSSNDFGSVVVPVAPPADGSVAAWFLASATEMTGLGLVKIDATGGASAQTLSGSAVDDLDGNPVTAMAEIPGTGTALLGAPTFDSLLTVDLASQTVSQFIPMSPLTQSDSLLGVGVAAGKLTGAAMPDLVVASSSLVHVFVDGSTADIVPGAADLAACPITLSTGLPNHDRQNRALVVGNLLASGPAIAIGTPAAAAAGSVSLFTATATAVICAGVLTAPALGTLAPSGTPNSGFGQTLAIGDVDGDGVPDLLVGAPPYAVYMYKGPVAPSAAPTATIAAPSGSANFGASLAALNSDGKPGDEALIGDPGATVNGQTDAGNATLYTYGGTGTGGTGTKVFTALAPVLTDHNAGTGEAYGSAVGALSFCAVAPCSAPPSLPLVGAPAKVFTYFTLGPTDPRTK